MFVQENFLHWSLLSQS